MLFYLNGVALFTRAKVFYDTPRGFSEALGADERSHFGNGWRAYFDEEARDGTLVADVAGNKKCYPWSILGDWTVRLRHLNGFGVITLSGGKLAGDLVHADNAWVAEWNCSSNHNEIEQIGDFDGNGSDDILASSPWGICILTLDGDTLDSIDASAYKLPIGDWYLQKTDHIRGVGKFSGGPRTEILLKKSN